MNRSVLIAFFVSALCFGSREIRISNYPVRQVYEFPGAQTGVKAGLILSHELSLINLSNVDQTVTVSLMKESRGYALDPICGMARWPIEVVHCFGSSNGKNSGVSNSSLLLPIDVSQVIPPKSGVAYRVVAIASGTVTNTTALPCPNATFRLADFTFSPALKISVKDDVGAILATLTPNIDAATNGTNICGSYPLTGYNSAITGLTNNRTTVPLLVNGGRPF